MTQEHSHSEHKSDSWLAALFYSSYLPERKVHGNAHIVLAIILLVVVSDLSCISCFSFLSLSSCSESVRAASVGRRGDRWVAQTSGQS